MVETTIKRWDARDPGAVGTRHVSLSDWDNLPVSPTALVCGGRVPGLVSFGTERTTPDRLHPLTVASPPEETATSRTDATDPLEVDTIAPEHAPSKWSGVMLLSWSSHANWMVPPDRLPLTRPLCFRRRLFLSAASFIGAC